MELSFSIIIPVYNRPNEVSDLLSSLTEQTYEKPFEIICVEDGSEDDSKDIVEAYEEFYDIKYFEKENTGAGLSRNYGMERASGNYFIIFDSDCLIPKHYLQTVEDTLLKNYTDVYGGPDAAHESFTTIQKAINFSMTSVITTGGIRGKKKAVGKFQPRSFNLGMSKKAFEITKGFSAMKVGEDIDFSFRLLEHGMKSQLIPDAFVYHKRRANLDDFYNQTFAFGEGRPYLNRKFKGTAKITYWFPTLFVSYWTASLILLFNGIEYPSYLIGAYLVLVFIKSFQENKDVRVAAMSILTTIIQFFGYGLGFLKGMLRI